MPEHGPEYRLLVQVEGSEVSRETGCLSPQPPISFYLLVGSGLRSGLLTYLLPLASP